MFISTKEEATEPFEVKLTTVPGHKAYVIIPDISYIGDSFDSIIKFKDIRGL